MFVDVSNLVTLNGRCVLFEWYTHVVLNVFVCHTQCLDMYINHTQSMDYSFKPIIIWALGHVFM